MSLEPHQPSQCPDCGTALTPGQPQALCPRCALKGALDLSGETKLVTFEDQCTTGVPSPQTRTRSFGDYELLEEIARGGMGVVYRARQTSLNRDVALKMILAGQLARAEDVRRFRAEAEAAARLQHPNIVAIHEVGEQDGLHYFSMDLVEGQSLAHLLRTGPLPARRAAGYVKIIAEAIHFAHTRGILHRDLKPSNVLIDSNDHPRVMDFGLAKNLAGDSSLTVTGQVYGSPSFMPPEQASGQRGKLGVTSDVYSLGAILYHTLTGRPPFVGESVAETLKQVEHTEPIAPRLLKPGLPRDLETICLKCLQKEPGGRYPSAQELALELGRFLGDEPIRARPVSRLERSRRWCRRKPAVASLAAGIVVLILAVAIGSPIALLRIDRERQRAERNARDEARQRLRAQEAVTHFEIERAETLFAADSSATALAHLARLLRQQPTNQVVAERLLSALGQRNFCLPSGPPLRPEKPARAGADLPVEDESALSVFLRNGGTIPAGQFSPDGQRRIAVVKGGTVLIWNTRTGLLACAPLRHDSEVKSAQFNSDGRRVVTASLDGSARIWDAQTGQLTGQPLEHDVAVVFARFSLDGRKVVTAAEDHTARVWETRTSQLVSGPFSTTTEIKSVTLSSDNTRLLVTSAKGPSRLFNLADGTENEAFVPIRSARQFSPDLRYWVFPRTIYEWVIVDLTNNLSQVGHPAHDAELVATAISPDGQLLATASWDNTARLWDLRTGSPIAMPLKHENWVVSVQFDAEGRRLVTGSKDKSARVWDVRTGLSLTEPLRHEEPVVSAQFGPDGQHVLTRTASGVAWQWDLRLAQPLTEPLQHSRSVRHATFSPDGRRVATMGTDGTVQVWNALTGQTETGPLKQGGEVWDGRFSPDGRRLATAALLSGGVQLLDFAALESATLQLNGAIGAYSVRFSPDGHRVVTAARDRAARIWDAASGERLASLAHAGAVSYAEYSRDGQRIVTASYDTTARVWDAHSTNPVSPPLKHDAAVLWAEFSPDGRRVVTASKDKAARVWDALTGRLLARPLLHADELHEYFSVQFNSTGEKVATAAGTSAQIWNAHTGEPVVAPLKHGGRVNSARFSPDGTRLLTASHDGTARIWDAETGHALTEPLRHGARVTYAEFSPDGRHVVTASYDKTARVWDVPPAPRPIPDWLPDLAEAVAGQRIDPRNFSAVVPLEELLRLKRRLGDLEESDHYARWAKWFFAASSTRAVSPLSPDTVPVFADRRIEQDTTAALETAIRLAPKNGLAFARLARQTLAQTDKDNPRHIGEADFFSRRAVELSPDNPEVQRIRTEVAEQLTDLPKP